MNQKNIPILQMLEEFSTTKSISFHVPGHKSGVIFPEQAKVIL